MEKKGLKWNKEQHILFIDCHKTKPQTRAEGTSQTKQLTEETKIFIFLSSILLLLQNNVPLSSCSWSFSSNRKPQLKLVRVFLQSALSTHEDGRLVISKKMISLKLSLVAVIIPCFCDCSPWTENKKYSDPTAVWGGSESPTRSEQIILLRGRRERRLRLTEFSCMFLELPGCLLVLAASKILLVQPG